MGLPALQHGYTTETTRRTSRGSSSTRRPSKSRPGKRRPTAKGSTQRPVPAKSARRRTRRDPSRAAFGVVSLLLCALAIFGLGRVALAAQATEASFEASQIREDIKAERLDGQLLEVDKSALTTPSRIEAIAGSTMKMADADDVCYLALPQGPVTAAEPVASQDPESSEVATSEEDGGVVQALMDMAAEEAHVLLVGDVGLASPR